MATTELQITISGSGDKTHAYGAIETLSGTTITDSDLLQVSINGTLLTPTTDYTVDAVNEDIIIDAGYTVAADDLLVISRVTDIDNPYVDFTNNTTIESNDLDLNFSQIRFAMQELQTDLGDVITYDAINAQWDGEGRRLSDLLPGTMSNDAVTLSQVNSLIAGTEVASTTDGYTQYRSGDGSTTVFTCPTFPLGDAEADRILVFIDGVQQYPTTATVTKDYSCSVSGSNVFTVTFTSAPPTGTNNILIRALKGTVQTTLDASSISGTAIQDGTVTISKLTAGSGAANRFFVFDTDGDGTASTVDHTMISDFDTGVRQNRLDQMAAPTTSVALGSQKITGLGTGASGTSDACTVAQMETYADAVSSPAASNYGMEPYDTSGDPEWTASVGTARSATGLAAGIYDLTVHCSNTGSGSLSVTGGVGSVVRDFIGTTGGETLNFKIEVNGTGTLTVSPTNCSVRNLSYHRIVSA